MPRSTKNSRASGDERDQPLVLSGEEDGVAPLSSSLDLNDHSSFYIPVL
jgi:hypothetical protein